MQHVGHTYCQVLLFKSSPLIVSMSAASASSVFAASVSAASVFADGFRMDGRRWKVDWASYEDFKM